MSKVSTVRAKLTVTGVTKGVDGQENVYLSAQYNGNKPEDNTYAAATPSANMNIAISNPEVYGFFQQGKKYYVDFQPVQE